MNGPVHLGPSLFLLPKPIPIAFKTAIAMEKKLTEKIAALPPDANYFSLEFFPPKTRMVG
jgi:methylenetetrahydrofolate reductase (NADPH)